nr:MAG TPA: repressor domain protein [Caudoviricetes sp.]
MEKLQIFNNAEFGEIRTANIDNEVWFVGKDVAVALGYANARKAILDHIDEDDKGVTKCDTLGGVQELTVINESGVYALVFSSKLPKAKEFKKWVTSEVLPSIRKNGGYISGQENLSDEELLAKALLVAQNKIAERDRVIQQQEEKIEEMKPKAIFADAVSSSETSILIGDMAKLLRQNGVEIGQKRLFEWLRNKSYLVKRKGSDWNMPTQRSMEMGFLKLRKVLI